jgi:predicted amidohydrolase
MEEREEPMSERFVVACVQMCAGEDLGANLTEAEAWVRQAQRQGASLVCLPEYFADDGRDAGGRAMPGAIAEMRPHDDPLLRSAHTEEAHPALPHFRALARELAVHLLLGSLAVKQATGRIHNRSYLLDTEGRVVSTYNKMHLFDVSLHGRESYLESNTVDPGDLLSLAPTPWGLLGLSICYDLRFAALYRALAHAGAAFLAVPAAFTQTTGAAHWHVLLRARAIETGSYVFAPDQCGIRSWGRATFGHSLIIDPWGRILADGGVAPGIILAEIDPARVAEVRAMIPALTHDRVWPPPQRP